MNLGPADVAFLSSLIGSGLSGPRSTGFSPDSDVLRETRHPHYRSESTSLFSPKSRVPKHYYHRHESTQSVGAQERASSIFQIADQKVG